ncbi:MAG: HD domain-containing phosphohydrolase [Rhodospirillales bacterium]
MNGQGRRAQLYTLAACLLLGIVTVASAAAILKFADAERAREVAAWRARLGIVADSRLAQAQGWLEAQLGEMRALAENQSVQLYLTELDLAQGVRSGVTDEPAQIGYLRNLLIVTAERAGFGGAGGAPVGANVRRTGSGGIALIDARDVVVASTPDMPPIDEAMRRRLDAAPRNRPAAIDAFKGAHGRPTLGFVAPIFAVQSDPGASQRIGYVLGVRELGEPFFRLLKQPGAAEPSAEAAVLRRAGNAVEYVTPHGDIPALDRSAPADAADLAEALGAAAPGGFFQARDWRQREVLAVSRAFAVLPWVLVYKVDAGEALGEADARRRDLIVGLGLVVAAVAAGFVAVWWYASSRRASAAARRYRDLARLFERQETLLRGVTDSQPDLIYLVDRDGRLRFANAAVAAHGGVPAGDLVGKTLPSALGPAHAAMIAKANRKAEAQGRRKTRLMRLPAPGGPDRVAQTSHIPLGEGGVVVVERDVTELVGERERRARAMGQVVDMLVGLVDRRDPYCADQAARVGQVAGAVAEAMGLEAAERATLDTAARLMNLGKVTVPQELLTRTGKLDDAEMLNVRESILNSAEYLRGIEFDGPVQETLRQLQEHVDGSGYPRGLQGEAILLPARILAVANAFVSMVSPRAWRDAIGIDRAIELLRQDRDRAFDRRAVAALEHALENRGGRQAWAGFAARPATGAA